MRVTKKMSDISHYYSYCLGIAKYCAKIDAFTGCAVAANETRGRGRNNYKKQQQK
jgi:hypothetical protein